MAKTQARAITWPMMKTAELAAAYGVLPEADPELAASLLANGFEDPIYVIAASSGLRVVDGVRRLAAAHAAGIEEVPTTDRPVIRLSLLASHPGNVRRDLRLTKETRASITEEGIRIALLLTRDPEVEGGIRVIDGHRRVAFGLAIGLTHAPYQWDGDRDEASQFLDMVTTARHREGLTQVEEAAALFAASEAGAKISRVAKAAGLTVANAKLAVRAGGSKAVARMADKAQLSLADMAALAELEEADPEAAKELEQAIRQQPMYAAYRISEARKKRERMLSAQAHRAELEAAGARIFQKAELSEKAAPAKTLPGGESKHEGCRGTVWVLLEDAATYTQYCSNAVLFGHVKPEEQAKQAKDQADPEKKAARRNVIKGNLDWEAATPVRIEWVKEFLSRTRHPKELLALMQEVTTRHLLAATNLMDSYDKTRPHALLGELLGKPTHYQRSALAKDVEKASGPRRTVLAFAVLCAAYEACMDRAAWRTETEHNYYRRDAAEWLALLARFGYAGSPIEQATRDGQAYDALTKRAVPLPGKSQPTADEHAEESADADGADAEEAAPHAQDTEAQAPAQDGEAADQPEREDTPQEPQEAEESDAEPEGNRAEADEDAAPLED